MELRGFVLLSCLLSRSLCSDTAPDRTFLEPHDFLFDTAVEAYSRGDWLSVILNMEKALLSRSALRRVKADCRERCANQTAFGEPLAGLGVPIPGVGSVDDLGFFQKILKRADCVNSCESEKLGPPTLHLSSAETELEFRKRTPYNYLQVAYFKINKLDKAVAAANTFFQANPLHTEMKQNLEYYRMMAGVTEEDFKDLEIKPHMADFLTGKRYYSHDSFGLAADYFESALNEYFPADRECRALCEGSYNYDGYNYMEYSADLFQTMTDHYTQVLNCKQRCSVELASNAGSEKPFDDFLPSQFNYLQFSYYNSENFAKAIECAKTYLLFHPEDVVMKQNLAYYSVVLGEKEAAAIAPRQVVRQYIQQSILEKQLLYFAFEAFGIAFVDPDSWTPEDVMPQKLRDKQKADKETAARITEEIGNLMKEIETLVEEKKKDSSDLTKMVAPPDELAVAGAADASASAAGTGTAAGSGSGTGAAGALLFDNIRISMTAKQLNGSERVLLDAVVTDDECRELQRLSNAAALKGDGYRGRPSPHTPSETFQGVTVMKAVKLGQEGKVPLKSARLFFDLSEKVRLSLETYFHLKTTLYFSYTHLVCRTAVDDDQDDRKDLSHPVHVDNCVLVSEINECIKEPPAYTHRDYSAILYLNDDFEGGDFIFTELDGKTVTAEVRPRCGRVVGFGSGRENPHGVRAVTKGQRCAVALWFTLDPAHQEKERIQAGDMLQMFSTPVDAEFIQKDPEPQTPDSPSSDHQEAAHTEAAALTAEGPTHPQDPRATEEKKKKKKKEDKADSSESKDRVKTTGDKVKTTGDKDKVKTTGDKVKTTGDKVKTTGDKDKVKNKAAEKRKTKTKETATTKGEKTASKSTKEKSKKAAKGKVSPQEKTEL
ncbi:unnamed protein product [Knipowitschia caucasica]|uniref:procollagen-proline 3-dioxygenase n=1 Tax=Knipowitschia caucasica TaxID=637954 RepID=A0AAV2M322_KNICA